MDKKYLDEFAIEGLAARNVLRLAQRLRASGSREGGLGETGESGGQSGQEGDEAGGVHLQYRDDEEVVVRNEVVIGLVGNESVDVFENSRLLAGLLEHFIYRILMRAASSSPPQQTIMPSPKACHHVCTTTGILLEHWHHTYPRGKPSA